MTATPTDARWTRLRCRLARDLPVRVTIPGYGVVVRPPAELDVIAERLLKLHVAEQGGASLAARPSCLYCEENWLCRAAAWAKGWQASRLIGWRGLARRWSR